MKADVLWIALAAAAFPASEALAQSAAAPKLAPAQSSPARAPAETKADKTVEEVVVTADKPQIQTSIDRRSYSVAGDLQTQTGSIADALRNVPSVQVDVLGNLTLRGDAGVTIMIDGKPSTLFTGDNRGNALMNLPAERIERVEVITNPTAEFRADGAAGIINLVTKQQRGAGRTGSLRLNAISGGRLFAGVNGGFNSNRLTLSADAGFRHETQSVTSVDERSRRNQATGLFEDSLQLTDNDATGEILNGRLGVDYDLDRKTRVSGEIRVQYQDVDQEAVDDFVRINAAGAPILAFDRSSVVGQNRGFLGTSATWRRKYAEGHELTFSAEWEATELDFTRFTVTDSSVPDTPAVGERMRSDNSLRYAELKGDYTRPVGKGGKLKAGFDLDFLDNDYDVAGFRATGGPYAPEPSLTNLFLFDQRLAQAYVTFEKPFGDFTVLAGLRLEDVSQDLDSVTQQRMAENDYFHAYPSLHLGWKASDTQTWKASYSRRVTRPSPDLLNPFRYVVDAVTYRSGNPNLRPQQTDSFELGWEYRKQPAFYLATLYYRDSRDGFVQILRDLGDGTYLYRWENISKGRAAGLELTANGRLNKKLTYNLSANAYWTELDSATIGLAEKRSGTTAFGRAVLNWQATPNDFVQFNAFINGKRFTPQGECAPQGMLNIGWRRKINDRISILATAQDVLKTFRDEQKVDTPDLKADVRRKIDTRLFVVGFVWNFGGGRPREAGFDFGGGGTGPQ